MTKTLTRIAFAAALMAGAYAAPASAQSVRELAQAGGWTARMMVSDRNVPMCVMSSVTRQVGFHIKYFRGTDNLVVHVFRDGWQLQQNAQVPMTLDIDRNENWSTNASSMGDGIEFTVGQAEMPRFETALRSGRLMSIQLGTGNKTQPLQVQLAGVDAVSGAFIECMRTINGRGGAQGAGAPAPQPAEPRAVQPRAMQPRDLDA